MEITKKEFPEPIPAARGIRYSTINADLGLFLYCDVGGVRVFTLATLDLGSEARGSLSACRLPLQVLRDDVRLWVMAFISEVDRLEREARDEHDLARAEDGP